MSWTRCWFPWREGVEPVTRPARETEAVEPVSTVRFTAELVRPQSRPR